MCAIGVYRLSVIIAVCVCYWGVSVVSNNSCVCAIGVYRLSVIIAMPVLLGMY